jgi:hypothetical protein
MFTFNTTKIVAFDLRTAGKFVDFWSNFYNETTKIFESDKKISYFDELNLGNELTKENVKRLLRWKDPVRLTEKIGTKKTQNEKVKRVLENRENINKFRDREINEEKFGKIIKDHIFNTGIIWRVFLFHIARPWEFPMADNNVFRVYRAHTKKMDKKQNWDFYGNYKEYFFEIAKSAGFIETRPNGREKNIKGLVERLKRVDNAILMFGKFLK